MPGANKRRIEENTILLESMGWREEEAKERQCPHPGAGRALSLPLSLSFSPSPCCAKLQQSLVRYTTTWLTDTTTVVVCLCSDPDPTIWGYVTRVFFSLFVTLRARRLAPCTSSFPMERAAPVQATVVDHSTCLPESSDAWPRCMVLLPAADWLTRTARFGCRHLVDAWEQLKKLGSRSIFDPSPLTYLVHCNACQDHTMIDHHTTS